MSEIYAAAVSLYVVNYWIALWIKGPGIYHWYELRKKKK